MRPRPRCSIPAAAGPKPVNYSLMRAMTDHGAEPTHRSWPMSTRRTEKRCGRSRISPVSMACCKSMAMPATKCWPNGATCSLPSAGPMSAATFTNSPRAAPRQSPPKPWRALPPSTGLKATIRGRSAEERRAVRQQRSLPLVEALQAWLRQKLSLISQKTKLAEAIRYALWRWAGLRLFLEDGRIEIDNNVVERSIRPLALTRKNALFAGSDGGAGHWAVLASLIESCKLLGVEPHAYLGDVITRIVNGHPQTRLDELMPWGYPVTRQLQVVA